MTKTPARGTKKYKKVPLFGRVDKRRLPRPDQSARMKAMWEDPEYRANQAAAISASHKADPTKHSRAGVPTGHTRETVAPLWARARELADRFIMTLKKNGDLPEVATATAGYAQEILDVPASDDGKAAAALHECFMLAVGPSDAKIKIQAINTVLNFTKSKPESKSKLTLARAEDFLDEIAKDA